MSKICKVYVILNYLKHLFILFYTITGCISFSAVALLVGIPIVNRNSAVRLKICVINTVIKKYN